MLVGYARVSTHDQNLDLQTEAFHKAGCRKIFEDRASGSRAERLVLAQAWDSHREGDTLVVWKLHRLGRSVKRLADFVGELQRQGVLVCKPRKRLIYGTIAVGHALAGGIGFSGDPSLGGCDHLLPFLPDQSGGAGGGVTRKPRRTWTQIVLR